MYTSGSKRKLAAKRERRLAVFWQLDHSTSRPTRVLLRSLGKTKSVHGVVSREIPARAQTRGYMFPVLGNKFEYPRCNLEKTKKRKERGVVFKRKEELHVLKPNRERLTEQ